MKFKFWGRKRKPEAEKCPICNGLKEINGVKCNACGGTGVILEATRNLNVNVGQARAETWNRNINDIQIQVLEGLSGTRQIFVNAWSKEDALDMLKKIREELGAK